ncbi:membrane protein [Sinorhizobium fredii USDA 205]|uniref:Cytochrome c-type biogenesis protein DsbD, protein-disulfide reductase n=1 Tax=Rhizobium fredii TaxID=380 RepID=A0A844AC94_RHIFR|nr:DUF6064 family protein [Sinorhizobium fredii]ASY72948.1 Cytochrome c-type biogenesis protein DsbD, protein-disulfide reductase [Sinorhizobium fredii CCBAU 83666]KSV85882.1 membrane protein [Sinorhizobium fredii USDA 205]MQX09475.1 hypothetical protein [Sinorhizobium fredii]GEC31233.1 hypothetical protein EFR01_14040 [Sinorhizobium fredii]GLS07562.1 hypothetical protein GCM10007864_11890 [Sinorhizobium fredii]
MSDWATYTLQDLLLFSPRVYFRLIERYNQDFWPLQIVLIAVALAVLVPAAVRVDRLRLAVPPILALAWVLCAWQFLWMRYAGINWAMPYAAAAFWIQAALLVLVGPMAGDPAPAGSLRHYGGIGLSMFGLLAYPFIAWLAGRSPVSAETFGMMPDPTVATTFGAMLLLGQRRLWLLMPIPVAWSLYSGLTLWAMREPAALGPLGVLAAFLVVVIAGRR